MDIGPVNAIDLCSEAILQLEELKQHFRDDAPAVEELFNFLRTPRPSPTFLGHESMSMLADVRSYAILRDSLAPKARPSTSNYKEFRRFIEQYLDRLESGVRDRKIEVMEEAKQFFLAFTENLLSRRFIDLYKRRERANSQHVYNDALS